MSEAGDHVLPSRVKRLAAVLLSEDPPGLAELAALVGRPPELVEPAVRSFRRSMIRLEYDLTFGDKSLVEIVADSDEALILGIVEEASTVAAIHSIRAFAERFEEIMDAKLGKGRGIRLTQSDGDTHGERRTAEDNRSRM